MVRTVIHRPRPQFSDALGISPAEEFVYRRLPARKQWARAYPDLDWEYFEHRRELP